MQKRTSSIFLLIIILFAAYLRFSNYSSWSLTNDELSALYGVSLGSLPANLNQYVYEDMHPAGVQVFLWGLVKLFGNSEAVVRFPFVLMGILTVLMMFYAGKELAGQTGGLLSAACMAVLQFPVLYSQLARPYSPGVLLSVTLLWLMLKLSNHKTEKVNNSIYGLFTLALTFSLYTHYFLVVSAALTALFTLILAPAQRRLKIFICGLVSLLLFLPHYKLSSAQLMRKGLNWLGKPEADYFWNYLNYAFNDFPLLLILAILPLPYLFIYKSARISKPQGFMLALFIIPFLFGYWYSKLVSPVLQLSILIFSFPALILLLFSFYNDTKFFKYGFTSIILISGLVQVKAVNHFSGSREFAPFREVAEDIKTCTEKFKPNNLNGALNIINPWYLSYYTDKMGINPRYLFVSNNGREDLIPFIKQLQSQNEQLFGYFWTNAQCPPVINSLIEEYYPYLVFKKYYFNAESYLYSRQASDSIFKVKSKTIFNNNFKNLVNGFEPVLADNIDTSDTGTYLNYHLFAKNEFGPTWRGKLNQILNKASDVIEAGVDCRVLSQMYDIQLVITIDHSGENYFWSSANLKFFTPSKQGITKLIHAVRLPQIKGADDVISVYIYNPDKAEVKLGNFYLKVKEGNPILYGQREDENLFSNLAP